MTTTTIPADLAQAIPTVWESLRWGAPRDIIPLTGEASARRYFRVIGADRSRMLMVMPVGASSVSEEISKISTAATKPPFLQIQQELATLQLPVPNILHHDAALGWIVLDDLGDIQLAHHVEPPETAVRLQWYRKAIDLLCVLQTQTHQGLPADSLARQRAFDTDLLNWEFDHFWEYGLLARGQQPTADTREQFVTLTRAITAQITAMPYGFTHRDYQSRNIMVVKSELILIDFQDALQGPYIYDVVSLLRDSYVELTTEELSTLVAYYAAQSHRPLTQVQHDFALVTVQRKLKDAGRFVYIDQVKQNPNFLPFIPASLGYVAHALRSDASLLPLYDLLQPFVPEWAPR